jgi:hypothetical protein
VGLHGGDGREQPGRDLAVRRAIGDQRGDAGFSRGQLIA